MITLRCPKCGKDTDVVEDRPAACPACGEGLVNPELCRSTLPPEDMRETLPPDDGQDRHSHATVAPNRDMAEISRAIRYDFLGPPINPGDLGKIGHYRVIRMLGEGGMGLVFHAEDIQLQRPVAFKIMRPEIAKDASSRQRFLREARAMAAVRNDHVVTIHHVSDEQVPFLAMELLEGETLDDRLGREPKLTIEKILRLGSEIAGGLAAAHERGLIHRDIKPANIWLQAPGSRAKILDFGLARPSEDVRLTRTGTVMGTPVYMAPEQARGEDVDGRADLFSLGCVLYEMTTGKLPFEGNSTIAVLQAIAVKEPTPPREFNRSIPQPLANLILRLLAKSPDDRPATAFQLRSDLLEIAAGRTPANALPPGQGVSRRTFIAAGLLGLAGIGGYFGWHAMQSYMAVPPPQKDEILLGMSAPFSGPTRQLGHGMKLGMEVFFDHLNEQGGVNGHKIKLIALDDGYEPVRALANVRELVENRKVFAIIGNVGTPTAQAVLPYILEKEVVFFGPFTGAKLLRDVPPDRFVFNYRASYEEETAGAIKYLLTEKRLKPEEIAVFAQADSFGDDGFNGVARGLRPHGVERDQILRVGYDRNSADVTEAVAKIQAEPKIEAVVMVATYRPAARFIQRLKENNRDLIFTNVSFVNGVALVEELGPKKAQGVIVTQVVPHFKSQSNAVTTFRERLAESYPNETPDFVSLEGYIDAAILTEGLNRCGDELTTATLIEKLESIDSLDLGIGTIIRYGPSEHQGSHKVWGTIIDKNGKFLTCELE